MAVIFASCLTDVGAAYTMQVTFNIFFGAAIFLIIFWRRLTLKAILGGLVMWVADDGDFAVDFAGDGGVSAG